MIIRRALLNNAGPFLGEWEVSLGEGTTVIVAEYEGEEERSNRAGKSWFAVDAVLYSLFGTFRGKVDDFAHRLAAGKEDAFVEHDMESSDGRIWRLRRGRTAAGEPIRTLNGDHISDKDLLRTVEREILGLSLDEYRLTCAFVQGEMHEFMRMTPEQKRRVVSPWFQTDRWVPRYELAAARLGDARRRLTELARSAALLDAAREELSTLQVELHAVEAAEEAAAEALAASRKELDAASRQLEALAEGADRVALQNQLEALRAVTFTERRTRERELKDAQDANAEARAAFDEATRAADRIVQLKISLEGAERIRAERAETEVQLRTARAEEVAADAELRRLLALHKEMSTARTGICPVLGEACDRIAADPGALRSLIAEGKKARAAAEDAAKRADSLSWKFRMSGGDLRGATEEAEELKVLQRLKSPAEAEGVLERARARREKAERDLKQLEMGRTEAQREAAKLQRRFDEMVADAADHAEVLEQDAERLKGQVRLAKMTLRDASSSLGCVQSNIGRVEEEVRRATEAERFLPDAKLKVERLAWSAYAFGVHGIPSREMENAFGVAEDEMNSVLEDLKSPQRMRFSPTRELKEWEPACLACGTAFAKGERTHVCVECATPRRRRRRDELRMEVLDGENESRFELDSGGGQVLLSLAGRIGLSRLPGRSRSVACLHLIIDEPDGALDGPNRAALHALLRDRLEAVGVRQTLLITHADVRREFNAAVIVQRFPGEDYSGVWEGE